jgi:hypothetical protein
MMGISQDIVLKRVEETLAEIQRARKGEHDIFIYPEMEYFRKVYPEVCKKRLADNDIVLFLTYYEPVDDVFARLAAAGIDVDEQRKKGNLIVADAVEEFFCQGKDFLLFLVKLERKIKELGKNNVSVILSMSVFMLYDKEEDMLEYEGLLDMSETRNWKVLCCYHKNDYEKLSEPLREDLKARHNRRLIGT